MQFAFARDDARRECERASRMLSGLEIESADGRRATAEIRRREG